MLSVYGDNEIRPRLSQYIPGSPKEPHDGGFKRVCLQLFGMPGHGKSSFINSCLCVVKDNEFSNLAGAEKSSEPVTTKKKDYKLSDTVYITDNRGINKMNQEEIMELAAQFRQLRSNNEVTWNLNLKKTTDSLLDCYTNPPDDFIVPVFVYSVNCPLLERRFEEIRQVIKKVQVVTGMYPIIVLTHHVKKDISIISNRFKEIGISCIIPIENYTTANCARNLETDKTILGILEICLKEADRVISLKQDWDPKKEYLKNSTTQIHEIVNQEIKIKNEKIAKQEETIKRLEKEVEALKNKSWCILI